MRADDRLRQHRRANGTNGCIRRPRTHAADPLRSSGRPISAQKSATSAHQGFRLRLRLPTFDHSHKMKSASGCFGAIHLSEFSGALRSACGDFIGRALRRRHRTKHRVSHLLHVAQPLQLVVVVGGVEAKEVRGQHGLVQRPAPSAPSGRPEDRRRSDRYRPPPAAP